MLKARVFLSASFKFYFRCKHGVLSICYGEGDLEPFSGKLQLSTDGWKSAPVLSLREAARLLNPQNEFQGGSCKCKSECKTLKCACRKKGSICSSKCHGGRSCSNCPQPEQQNASDECKSPARKRHRGAGHSKNTPIEVSESTEVKDMNTWVPRLNLSDADRVELQDGDCLSDKHITAAQKLLKKQFPLVGGLQPPTLADTNQCSIMSIEGVQILNDNGNHWLCVSSLGCPANTVNMYDSIKPKVSSSTAKKVASLLHSQADTIDIRVMYGQLQTGVKDCGLFAIATATALCHGIPPSTTLWDQKAMREHLLQCFTKEMLVPFPAWDVPGPTTIDEEPAVATHSVKVYCLCRLPCDRRQKMAQCVLCGMWYHKACANIPDTVFRKKATFTCDICL